MMIGSLLKPNQHQETHRRTTAASPLRRRESSSRTQLQMVTNGYVNYKPVYPRAPEPYQRPLDLSNHRHHDHKYHLYFHISFYTFTISSYADFSFQSKSRLLAAAREQNIKKKS